MSGRDVILHSRITASSREQSRQGNREPGAKGREMTSWMERPSLSLGWTGGVTKDDWKEVEVDGA